MKNAPLNLKSRKKMKLVLLLEQNPCQQTHVGKRKGVLAMFFMLSPMVLPKNIITAALASRGYGASNGTWLQKEASSLKDYRSHPSEKSKALLPRAQMRKNNRHCHHAPIPVLQFSPPSWSCFELKMKPSLNGAIFIDCKSPYCHRRPDPDLCIPTSILSRKETGQRVDKNLHTCSVCSYLEGQNAGNNQTIKKKMMRWIMVYLYNRIFTQTLTYLQSLFNNKSKGP